MKKHVSVITDSKDQPWGDDHNLGGGALLGISVDLCC